MSLIVFFGLGIVESAENFFLWLSLSVQINLVGCAMGYFCGVTFDNDNAARALSTFMMLLFMLTAGGFNNSANYPPFIQQIQYISPMRYGVEGFFRGITRDLINDDYRDLLLERFGYTWGDVVVHSALAGIFVGFILLGWFVIYMKNRKY